MKNTTRMVVSAVGKMLLRSEVATKRALVESTRRERKEKEEETKTKVATVAEASLGGGWVAGKIFRWFAEKGFGFAKVAGEDVFVHVNALLGTAGGIIGAKVMLNIVKDEARTKEA